MLTFDLRKSFQPALPVTSAGLRGPAVSDAPPSPETAPETARLQSVHRLRDRMIASPEVDFDQAKYADLRDGGLMPLPAVDRTAVLLWLLMLAGGCAFWIWALPKIIRAIAAAIVIGANAFH